MTAGEINRLNKLERRKYSTTRFKKHSGKRNTTKNQWNTNKVLSKTTRQQKNVLIDRPVETKTCNKQNLGKPIKGSSTFNNSCHVNHNRHVHCFNSPFETFEKNKHVTNVDNANQSCLSKRYEIRKNECSFKKLKNLWKQQFDQFILPVPTRRNTGTNKTTYTEKSTITNQKKETLEMSPQVKNRSNNQSEEISQHLSPSKSFSSLSSSKYEVRSYQDYGENFLKNFEDKYTFSDSSNLTGSTIYLYCSTCSQIFSCRNIDELKQLNLIKSSSSLSSYNLTSEDEDIESQFVFDELFPSYWEYMNPSYEWIKSSRPVSAPPILTCSSKKSA
ncbi:unnamed protein product [Schistosoma margrebowiei]|uniref:Uncharacterized protein n=1 Tax=Schistosoma margrebowiei TaxID=48269 RepID=A0AA84ZH35_9TREM|nr:unnamed protein product [Schistosoma margrebowiei]